MDVSPYADEGCGGLSSGKVHVRYEGRGSGELLLVGKSENNFGSSEPSLSFSDPALGKR